MDRGEIKTFDSVSSALISLKSLRPKELSAFMSSSSEEVNSRIGSPGPARSQLKIKSKIKMNKKSAFLSFIFSSCFYIR